MAARIIDVARAAARAERELAQAGAIIALPLTVDGRAATAWAALRRAERSLHALLAHDDYDDRVRVRLASTIARGVAIALERMAED